MSLFRKKSLEHLLAQAADSEKGLKRTLGPTNLVALGIGAIIGAGLFVRTAAAAGQAAGPGVTLSFIVAAVGCAFAGLCYAEFASMIPIALGQGPGAAGRASMAKVIIGGQMLCLLLSLLVTPVSYSIFDDWSSGKFFNRRRKAERPTIEPPLAGVPVGK